MGTYNNAGRLYLYAMINIFTFINDILFYKKGNLLDNIDDESQFNGYMINRWLSMYSPQAATIINHTTNRYYSIFDTKRDNYQFLISIMPKSKPYRINYIKKTHKDAQDKNKDAIKLLADNLQISQREIKFYIVNGLDISSLTAKL